MIGAVTRLRWRVLAVLGLLGAMLCIPWSVAAHPLPNSTIQLAIHETYVDATVQIPLPDLGTALDEKLEAQTSTLLKTHEPQLRNYLQSHFQPTTTDGKKWKVDITGMHIGEPKTFTQGTYNTRYHELVVDAVLTPPQGATTRTFNLGYDAVIHKVSAHTILVSIRHDWSTGVIETSPVQVGVISTDPSSNKVIPLKVDVSHGNAWTGFVGMVKLGMNHIRTGPDHLLFLFTLLLPAPLIAIKHRWAKTDSTKKTLKKIIAITTAFTIGHSLTLIIATLGRLHIASQPIEALIAVSIIVSAIHALRPIFPGKEVLVAGGFGLIHGTAFSFTLAALDLNRSQTVVSLLGFNLGIELMQLVIIFIVMPTLVILASKTKYYSYVRIAGASIALVAAIGWLFTRLGLTNPIGTFADSLSAYVNTALIAMVVITLITLIAAYNAAHPRNDTPDDIPGN